jgi:hypothetical protein
MHLEARIRQLCSLRSARTLPRECFVQSSVIDNTDWRAAAAMVDDLELERGFGAEYKGKL